MTLAVTWRHDTFPFCRVATS